MKGVKYLVNAAGVFSPKSFLEHTGEDYDAYLNLNKAYFLRDPAGGEEYGCQRRRIDRQHRLHGGLIRQSRQHLRRPIQWPRPVCTP